MLLDFSKGFRKLADIVAECVGELGIVLLAVLLGPFAFTLDTLDFVHGHLMGGQLTLAADYADEGFVLVPARVEPQQSQRQQLMRNQKPDDWLPVVPREGALLDVFLSKELIHMDGIYINRKYL